MTGEHSASRRADVVAEQAPELLRDVVHVDYEQERRELRTVRRMAWLIGEAFQTSRSTSPITVSDLCAAMYAIERECDQELDRLHDRERADL